MEKIITVFGLFLAIFVAYLLSDKKEEINWTSVGCAFVGQLVLGLLLIKTPLWKLVQWTGDGVTWLLNQATAGIDFVFGGISDNFVFFINSLLPIVFISAIMGILFHFGLIQKFVAVVGKTVAKLLKVDTLVAVNGVTNMFLGQNEALFVTKSYLPSASESVIFATLVGGMTSISVSVIGLYMSMSAPIEWIIVSLPLTVCSTFAITQILMPTKYENVEDLVIETTDKGVNWIETMMNYAMTGFKSVIGVTVALLVFLSLMGMVNNLLGFLGTGLTLEGILGYLFTPFAWLMGVPRAEVMQVAQILATKLVANEAVAFGLPQFATLSANAKAMTTVALCGFTGIGSIGILIGGYTAVAPTRVKTVAKLGIKALLTATVVTMMTGAVVSLML